VVKKICLKVE
jgi:hypothetical protein